MCGDVRWGVILLASGPKTSSLSDVVRCEWYVMCDASQFS